MRKNGMSDNEKCWWKIEVKRNGEVETKWRNATIDEVMEIAKWYMSKDDVDNVVFIQEKPF